MLQSCKIYLGDLGLEAGVHKSHFKQLQQFILINMAVKQTGQRKEGPEWGSGETDKCVLQTEKRLHIITLIISLF